MHQIDGNCCITHLKFSSSKKKNTSQSPLDLCFIPQCVDSRLSFYILPVTGFYKPSNFRHFALLCSGLMWCFCQGKRCFFCNPFCLSVKYWQRSINVNSSLISYKSHCSCDECEVVKTLIQVKFHFTFCPQTLSLFSQTWASCEFVMSFLGSVEVESYCN